jgi:hypothetical protein
MAKEKITFYRDDDLTLPQQYLLLEGIQATYWQLVNLFGEPQHIKSDRARVQWPVAFSDGEGVFIYDWNEDVKVEEVKQWNVGGNNKMIAYRIQDIIDGKPFEY